MSQPTPTAGSLLAGRRAGTVAAEQVIAQLQRVHNQTEPDLGAFLHFDSAAALNQLNGVSPQSQLAGLPVSLKDNLCAAGGPTTAGSKFLKDFSPPYEATVVERLRRAGAVILGKTNLDEFGMGSSTENSAFFPTRNPWNRDAVPGGSSGGAAAAIAAGSSLWGLASDTGGSIRQPASFCGLTGLKPTYGRVSRYGLIAYASSLDQIGPLAHDARDAALLLAIIAGHDPRDAQTITDPVPDYLAELERPPECLRIGLLASQLENIDPAIAAAVQETASWFRQAGHVVEAVAPVCPDQVLAAYYILASCEASSNLARYDGVRHTARAAADDLESMYRRTRDQYFGQEVKRRILLGTFALSSGYHDQFYLRANAVRRRVQAELEKTFAEWDLLLGPTTPTPAFPLQAGQTPLEMYQSDVFTVTANLAGIPAASFPCGFSDDGRPLGAQLMGPRLSESLLLRLIDQYQQQTDWHLRRPAV